MIIIQDSRETLPLSFSKSYIEFVAVDKLEFGDYCCVSDYGDWSDVYFERKSLGDLFGTLTSGYERFKKEVNRSVETRNKLVIIIEVSFTDILNGYEHSKVKGESIARTLFTLMTRHHIPFICCTSRREMSNYISEFYRSYFMNKRT